MRARPSILFKNPKFHQFGGTVFVSRHAGCSRIWGNRPNAAAKSEYDDFVALSEAARQKGLKDYHELKQLLLSRTRNASGVLTAYFTLGVSPVSGITTIVGSCAGYIYLLLLMRSVDKMSPGDKVPMMEANENGVGIAFLIVAFFSAIQLPKGLPRYFGKWVASYQHSLKPRLLVPVGLAVCLCLYNALSSEQLPLAAQGSLLFGFLSYKVAFFQLLYDDLKPQFDPATLDGPGPAPTLESGSGDMDGLDFYGRKKKTVEEKIEDVSGD